MHSFKERLAFNLRIQVKIKSFVFLFFKLALTMQLWVRFTVNFNPSCTYSELFLCGPNFEDFQKGGRGV